MCIEPILLIENCNQFSKVRASPTRRFIVGFWSARCAHCLEREPPGTATDGAMERFKPGDAVFILPKFAHLYPRHSAVITAVKLDPFRPMFNEYAFQF